MSRAPDTAAPGSCELEEIMNQYGGQVYYLCLMYLGDRQLAEDAFQITMTHVWQGLSGFRGESSLKTWIMRIAANSCRNMLRTGWFRMMRKSAPEEALFDQPALNADDALREVRGAILSLPGKYREVMLLYYLQGMTIKEIGELLKIPAGSVSTRLKRGKELIQIELKGGVQA